MSIFSESVQDTADLEKLHQRSFEKNKGVVLFKHSTRCIISKTVLRNLSAEWEVDEQNLPIYYLDLLSYRAVSNQVAADYGVEHQSPQIIVIKDGVAIYAESHHSISWDKIKELMEHA